MVSATSLTGALMKNYIWGIAASFVLASVVATGCTVGVGSVTSEPSATPLPEPSLTPIYLEEVYRDALRGYSIAYPEGWGTEKGASGSSIVHPLGTELVVTTDAKVGITLEEYAAVVVEDFFRTRNSDYMELSRRPLAGRNGLSVEVGMTPLSGPQTGREMFASFLIVEGYERFVAAVGIVRQSLKELHQPTLEAMLASLQTFRPASVAAPPTLTPTPLALVQEAIAPTPTLAAASPGVTPRPTATPPTMAQPAQPTPTTGAPTPTATPSLPKPMINLRETAGGTGSLINLIAGFIINNGYGYEVGIAPMAQDEMQTALPQGLVDVNMVSNTTRFGDWFNEATADGSIVNLGQTYEVSRFFMIPSWMHEEYRINTIYDLRFQWGRFGDSAVGSKGVFYTCRSEAIADCGEINEIKMEAYGLADNFDFVWPGGGEQFRTLYLTALEDRSPVFGYHTEPSAFMGTGDWYVLEEPAYTDDCWARITAALENSSLRPISGACAYPESSIDKYAWTGLLEKAPDVWQLLSNMAFEAADLSQTQAWASANGIGSNDWTKAALFYLSNYPGRWIDWMPPENFERVLQALP